MNTIEIVGLGAGDLEQLPLGVYRRLKEATHLYLRTKEHPVVRDLENEGVSFQSFDSVYEGHATFDEVYRDICNRLFSLAETASIVYAVPGHPLVAERTVQILLLEAKERGIHVTIQGGQSFLDPLFQAVQIDPIEGFQLLDGTSLRRETINIEQHLIIGQVYDTFIASEVKLTLMEKLPYDYPVVIVQAAGTSKERIQHLPLHELDREVTVNNLTSVYVPPVKKEEILYKEFTKLRDIIAVLRGPNGCPWDRKQTHQSLTKYLIEEAYELIEAIHNEDTDHIIEELGDCLLQIMLHAQIGEDEGYFTIDDVIEGVSAKMIRRHPHVFGEGKLETAEEVVTTWQEIKKEEKGSTESSLLEGIGMHLPNLMRAYELQKKAAKVGFDWEEATQAFDKVKEELKEFEEELARQEQGKAMQSEFGDLLFALVNVGRLIDVTAEEALFETNQKFTRRFQYIEGKVKESGRTMEEHSLEELDHYWNEAKSNGL